jgi:hypothetical protein
MSLGGCLKHRLGRVVFLLWLPFCALLLSPTVQAQDKPPTDDSVEVMDTFNQQAVEKQKAYELTDDDKHRVLFFMGVGLVLLLCTTAYLGISMVVFGKEVFTFHMISAGLTVTLGLAHAVAAIVWFFPF